MAPGVLYRGIPHPAGHACGSHAAPVCGLLHPHAVADCLGHPCSRRLHHRQGPALSKSITLQPSMIADMMCDSANKRLCCFQCHTCADSPVHALELSVPGIVRQHSCSNADGMLWWQGEDMCCRAGIGMAALADNQLHRFMEGNELRAAASKKPELLLQTGGPLSRCRVL